MYHATKYDSPRDEIIGSLSADWWDEDSGSVEAVTGWFARTSLTLEDAQRVLNGEDAPYHATLAQEHAVSAESLVGFWAITGDDRGFVYVTQHETEQSLRDWFDQCETCFSAWEEHEASEDTEPYVCPAIGHGYHG